MNEATEEWFAIWRPLKHQSVKKRGSLEPALCLVMSLATRRLNRRFYFPTRSVLLANVLIRLGAIGCLECRTVPVQLLAGSIGNVAKQNRFGERTGVVKVTGGWRSVFTRLNPFCVVPN